MCLYSSKKVIKMPRWSCSWRRRARRMGLEKRRSTQPQATAAAAGAGAARLQLPAPAVQSQVEASEAVQWVARLLLVCLRADSTMPSTAPPRCCQGVDAHVGGGREVAELHCGGRGGAAGLRGPAARGWVRFILVVTTLLLLDNPGHASSSSCVLHLLAKKR